MVKLEKTEKKDVYGLTMVGSPFGWSSFDAGLRHSFVPWWSVSTWNGFVLFKPGGLMNCGGCS